MAEGADKGNVSGPDGRILVIDLRRLQVAGDRVFGTRFLADEMVRLHSLLSRWPLRHPHDPRHARRQRGLARGAGVRGAGARAWHPPALRPIAELRQDTRPAVSNWPALAIAFGVPLVGLALLVRRGIRLRRSAGARAPQAA